MLHLGYKCSTIMMHVSRGHPGLFAVESFSKRRVEERNGNLSTWMTVIMQVSRLTVCKALWSEHVWCSSPISPICFKKWPHGAIRKVLHVPTMWSKRSLLRWVAIISAENIFFDIWTCHVWFTAWSAKGFWKLHWPQCPSSWANSLLKLNFCQLPK